MDIDVFRKLTNLKKIILRGNKFHGDLSTNLSILKIYEIDLKHNEFLGKYPVINKGPKNL